MCEEKLETSGYEDFEASYYDDISGKQLKPELVRESRLEELSTIKEMKVWEIIPRPKNERTVTTRWVDINKKDERKPKYRSRLVARELKKTFRSGLSSDPHTPSWQDFYAAMPPISALRTLFALATTRRVPGLDGRMQELPRNQCLVFLDIKKAHFWADARRRILVELPAETGVDTPKFVGLLKKSLYGTRDAPANWEATILRVMNLLGRRIRTRTFQQLPLLPPSSRHQSGGPRRRLHWTWSQRSAGVVFHRSWQALDGGKAWLFGSTGNARDQAEHRHPEQTCDMD